MLLLLGVLLPPCRETKKKDALEQTTQQENWNFDSLKHRASQNLDSAQWDMELYHQDLENYQKFKEIFQSFPLNKSPFPVAEYDYAVASTPFMIELDTLIFKGVSLGEHENPESEKIIYKLSLIVLTNDKNTQENTLVESRNYPYLTAQGTFEVEKNSLDWVFTASTDGYSTLLVNMKLFDLRFGETIIIYPQKDESFLYDQVKDSPNNYENFEEFKKAVLNHLKVRKL
ncbi:hypothetical protein SAMN05216474_0345 [Lishizhenia tianjinensis]|uniref:Uncharacterized protein n=1 Tax=Lishizhenia tianjinensis TaxID=477690 RepID=A0A1I6XPV6_9FLAO|nr:hypothetical protein [Lishizhenia tianjinensis]SFT39951.1 hypothetical protein SAMN05216474_0345 [Lishizhenia tianjinensis]